MIEYVPTEVAEAVLDEWRETERAAHTLAQGGVESARRILEAALGPERAAEVLERIEQELRETEGFRNLRLADPQQIASVLSKEYPQTIALKRGSETSGLPTHSRLPLYLARYISRR